MGQNPILRDTQKELMENIATQPRKLKLANLDKRKREGNQGRLLF